jgi:hypothetical protein
MARQLFVTGRQPPPFGLATIAEHLFMEEPAPFGVGANTALIHVKHSSDPSAEV